jgi:hypothetical protein
MLCAKATPLPNIWERPLRGPRAWHVEKVYIGTQEIQMRTNKMFNCDTKNDKFKTSNTLQLEVRLIYSSDEVG